KPRILYLVHGHPDFNAGGGEFAAWFMFDAVRRSGRFDPHLLAGLRTNGPTASDRPLLRHERCDRTYFFPHADYDGFYQTGRDLRPLAEYLTSFRPDIVH